MPIECIVRYSIVRYCIVLVLLNVIGFDDLLFGNRLRSAEKPNVLFILSEDQGSHLESLGTQGLRTPNIDRLAKSGVYFDNAFVAYPVCSASKAAIYTAVHNHTNGILNNTYNYHKPASQVTESERQRPLFRKNRILDSFLTLTEILHVNGYYQGVTHKLHVLPNSKFPYDEFLKGSRAELKAFIEHAKSNNQPWFLMVNIPNSHRPYPNSDKAPIRVDPTLVELPPFLPDSELVRKDWAEYLAGIEQVDALTGEALDVLEQSGESENTIVIYMSDHGPTFSHGKMTLYDLGLRVPFVIRGPQIARGKVAHALLSELDILPTIAELIEQNSGELLSLPFAEPSNAEEINASLRNDTQERQSFRQRFPYRIDGVSQLSVLNDPSIPGPRQYVFAEISNRGPLPNDGIQERTVFDQQFKLIYRENVSKSWRQVNADSYLAKPWGNRTYDETLRLKDKFPQQYQILAEMFPQRLGGEVKEIELYDLKQDPHELRDLANDQTHQPVRKRLLDTLEKWMVETEDTSMKLRVR